MKCEVGSYAVETDPSADGPSEEEVPDFEDTLGNSGEEEAVGAGVDELGRGRGHDEHNPPLLHPPHPPTLLTNSMLLHWTG